MRETYFQRQFRLGEGSLEQIVIALSKNCDAAGASVDDDDDEEEDGLGVSAWRLI